MIEYQSMTDQISLISFRRFLILLSIKPIRTGVTFGQKLWFSHGICLSCIKKWLLYHLNALLIILPGCECKSNSKHFFFHFFQTHLTYRFISINSENRNLKIFMIAGIFGPYRDHDCRHIWSLSDTIAGIFGPYRNQDCRHNWSPL